MESPENYELKKKSYTLKFYSLKPVTTHSPDSAFTLKVLQFGLVAFVWFWFL